MIAKDCETFSTAFLVEESIIIFYPKLVFSFFFFSFFIISSARKRNVNARARYELRYPVNVSQLSL